MKAHINNINDILIRPLVTEKSYANIANNVYTFTIHKNATRTDVKEAIETIFAASKAKVEKVNIVNVKGKKKRMGRYEGKTASYKKAIVYLKDGNIPVFGQEELDFDDNSGKEKIKNRIVTEDVLDSKDK